MYDYVRYVTRIKDNKKEGKTAEKAVTEAVDWAINKNLLNGFFKLQKEEVLAMSLTEFDVEEFKREMREEGSEERAIEATKNLYANGVSVEIIAKSLNFSVEEVYKIVNENAVIESV